MQEAEKRATLAEEMQDFEELRQIMKPLDKWSKNLVRTFATGIYVATQGQMPPQGAAM